MARYNSLQAQIEHRITHSSNDVFLTREFHDLGGERQVLANGSMSSNQSGKGGARQSRLEKRDDAALQVEISGRAA